jgi:hypothetical protein
MTVRKIDKAELTDRQKEIIAFLRHYIERVTAGEIGGVAVLAFDADGMSIEDDLAGDVIATELNAACDDIKFSLAMERAGMLDGG